MPKLIASVPKYRRHRASGQAIVTLNGRDHLGPHGTKSSKAEYERLIGQWLAAGRTLRRSAVDCDTTIAELCAAYLRFADRYYRKDGVPTRTIERVRLAIRVLRDLYGPTLAAEFGPLCLGDGHVRTPCPLLLRRWRAFTSLGVRTGKEAGVPRGREARGWGPHRPTPGTAWNA